MKREKRISSPAVTFLALRRSLTQETRVVATNSFGSFASGAISITQSSIRSAYSVPASPLTKLVLLTIKGRQVGANKSERLYFRPS